MKLDRSMDRFQRRANRYQRQQLFWCGCVKLRLSFGGNVNRMYVAWVPLSSDSAILSLVQHDLEPFVFSSDLFLKISTCNPYLHVITALFTARADQWI